MDERTTDVPSLRPSLRLSWGPLVIQLKYCPLLPSLNKVDYYYYYYYYYCYYYYQHVNSKLGRQHTKAPLAATLSPFMSLLYPPNPWCEWCVNLSTPPGSTSPTLFEQCCGFFYVPQERDKCKCCGTEPTVFSPYHDQRRLGSLTVCRCHYKGSTSFSVI